MNRLKAINQPQRIVVKIGTGLLTNAGRQLDLARVSALADQLAALRRNSIEVAVVSSGAIGAGMGELGMTARPTSLPELQACAAIGQSKLMSLYAEAFRRHGLHVAQILLTHADLSDRVRHLNARNTIDTLLARGVVPIINENDTVVTDEIKFGDNDTLGALVANLIEADAFVILTDQDGLYTADPRKDASASLISEAQAGDEKLELMAGGAGSHIGRGGMITKVLAAKRAARSGAHTVIASGHERDVLPRLLQGESIGTLLTASALSLDARKQWLADHLQVSGKVSLDAGAVRVLRNEGKSLLSIGVTQVSGEFQRGAVVAVLDTEGRDIARGLVNYNADEARRIAGKASGEIENILGYVDEPELIHRDNLVLL
ncbi:MAG TPA: glutamate 5-kinase [Gallionellaceae bacterium]|nr:glutamate 5-kinase [Gallionellaceae bacterium]